LKLLEAYAYQFKDPRLVEIAIRVRKRAERRLGELMREAPKAKGGDIGGRNPKAGSLKDPKTLSQQGIDKHLARSTALNISDAPS
jgi:hypothetical protein